MAKQHKAPMWQRLGWPWFPFVAFSILCALLPGFALATVLALESAGFSDIGYGGLVWAHGHAMVMGWGAAMVFGVALQFMPKLRGVKLRAASLVPWVFWVFVGGTLLRVFTLGSIGYVAHIAPEIALTGLVLQTAGVLGIMLLLGSTIFSRSGPSLRSKKALLQILPALVAAALSVVLAQCSWLALPWRDIALGGHNWQAVEILLFAALPLISLGMSARLLPLNFRLQPSSDHGLQVAAVLCLLGAVMSLGSLCSHSLAAIADFAYPLYAVGIGAGIAAIKIWHRRVPYPGANRVYRLSRDPAGLGVLSAYVWAAVAALLLVLYYAANLLLSLAPETLSASPALVQILGGLTSSGVRLAEHAMGAGFMTLLIFSVGWKMLPGFGKCLPQFQGLFAASVIFANLAAILRVVPGLALIFINPNWQGLYTMGLVIAGVCGVIAMLLFTLTLILSWRK